MKDELKTWPPSKFAFEQMQAAGEVKYGLAIPWERIEELFGINDRESWPFRGEWFALRGMFEEAGLFVTEAKMNDIGFRFLDRVEMADAVRNRENKKSDDSLRKSLALSKVPRDGLAENDVKKIDHWEAKAALIGATSKVLLRKRSLPSPEMAIRSVKEYLKDATAEE